jgi:hypothetical protein
MMMSVSAISWFSFLLLGLLLDALDFGVEPVEAVLSDLAVPANPIGRRFKRADDQPRRPPLRSPAPTDQPRPFEDLEVLRDSLHAHVERLGQLVDCRFATGQAGQDCPSRGVGQGGEGEAQLVVDRAGRFTIRLRSSSTCRLLN